MMAILHEELGIIDTLLCYAFIVIIQLNWKIRLPVKMISRPVFLDRHGCDYIRSWVVQWECFESKLTCIIRFYLVIYPSYLVALS